MADSEQEKYPSSETPEELARRLQSLLEESWSPTPETPAAPHYDPLEREELLEPEGKEEAPPAQPRPQPEKGLGGFLKKYRKERPQREKPSWYQPPREAPGEEPPEPPAPIKEEEPVQPEESAQMEVSSQPEAPAQPEPQQAEAPPQEAEPLPEEQPQQTAVPEGPEEAPAEQKEKKLSAEGGALLMLRDLVCILAALTLLFTFVVRISRVEGSSMYPSLVDGDQLLLTGSLWYGQPRRGDVVVARVPTFSRDPIVKRVIAVEGDTVDIDFEAGTVSVNGKVLEEPYINAPTHRSFGDQGTAFPLTVEKDHVFLLGDNRNDSYDSRYASIGQVDVRCILGKASVLLWPGWDDIRDALEPGRIGLIQ